VGRPTPSLFPVLGRVGERDVIGSDAVGAENLTLTSVSEAMSDIAGSTALRVVRLPASQHGADALARGRTDDGAQGSSRR
jgi:hypothetical protein